MQHHGCPTRLLDCTYSVYVAAYFALERAEGDCAVWGLDAPKALCAAKGLMSSGGKDRKVIERMETLYDENDERDANHLLWEPRNQVCAVMPANPFRLNERLR